MGYWLDHAPPTQLETHYSDRRVRCFVERPASLHAMLVEAAALAPQREALVCGDRRLNWRDVDHEVSLLAGGLADLGVAAGDRVALLLSNRAEFMLLLLAIARLGAITVPLNIREQTPELAYALAQCAAPWRWCSMATWHHDCPMRTTCRLCAIALRSAAPWPARCATTRCARGRHATTLRRCAKTTSQ